MGWLATLRRLCKSSWAAASVDGVSAIGVIGTAGIGGTTGLALKSPGLAGTPTASA